MLCISFSSVIPLFDLIKDAGSILGSIWTVSGDSRWPTLGPGPRNRIMTSEVSVVISSVISLYGLILAAGCIPGSISTLSGDPRWLTLGLGPIKNV